MYFKGPALNTFTYVTVVRVAAVSISPPSGERVLTNALLGWDHRPDAVLPSAKYRFPVRAHCSTCARPPVALLRPNGVCRAAADARQ